MSLKTPLYDWHKNNIGKLVDFAGWQLPVEFKGLILEHETVRKSVGLFDVSHMGEIEVKGKNALEFLQKITTNNVAKLKDNQVQYSAMCYNDGGVVDDILVHRFSNEHFFLCVNASNIEKDYNWLKDNNSFDVSIINLSTEYAQIAVQGPKSIDLLQTLTKNDLHKINRYWFNIGDIGNANKAIIARTGYTGEDGFELYIKPNEAIPLWETLIEKGKTYSIEPVGLGARDTLRLEVRYALYGNDIDNTTTLVEAGLNWIVDFQKTDFNGKERMLKHKEHGTRKKLVGINMLDRGIPRHGYKIADSLGNDIGYVTSGTFSPTLKKPIALAYLPSEKASFGTQIFVKIRDKLLKAEVIKTPFVTGTSLDKLNKKQVN